MSSSSMSGLANETFITEPLVKSIPALRPDPPDIQPGEAIIDIRPGIMTNAEIRKYQPRLPTISSISVLLSWPGSVRCSVQNAAMPLA